MTSKRKILRRFDRIFTLLLIFLVAASCGKGESKGPASAGAPSDSTFSLPLPKGLSAPLPGSDLTLTAKAIIDPGTPGARTVDLEVDPENRQVGGVIDGVTAGPHSIEVQYFLNSVKVAIAALNVEVTPGQNTTVTISETLVHYIEAVSDTLFIADNSTQSIAIFDHYAKHPGGAVSLPTPDRMLAGPNTSLSGLSPGGLFIDAIGGGLYVANDAPDGQLDSIRIWNNAAAADGDAKPDRVLEGLRTLINRPSGIAVDPFRNLLYVVNQEGELLIWDHAASLNGSVSPRKALASTVTGLGVGPHPIVLDITRDLLYVGNGSDVLAFKGLSRLLGDRQGAETRMIRITGGNLVQAGVALDAGRDLLYISSQETGGVLHKITGASTADGDVAPAAILSGDETGLNQASALALSDNILMEANQGASEIRVWHQADDKKDDASPTQIVAPSPAARPIALFFVSTRNIAGDRPASLLEVVKSGNGRGRIVSDRPGINCGTTCSAFFAAGSTIMLTAVAEAGHAFAGWEEGCTGTEVCTMTMDTAKSVKASFNIIQVPSPSPQGSVAAYAFSEGSGTTTSDASGRGNTGTLINGPVWTTEGKLGSALSFDGINDFVSVADNTTLDLGGAGTLSAWVRLDALNRWHGVIAKGTANNQSAHNYALEITETNRVQCIIGNGSASVVVNSTVTIAANQFRHLACRWDGTNLSLFIDGSLNASASQNMTPAGNGAPLFIGQYGGNTDRLDGTVDEVRIYNRALTPAEIQQDMITPLGAPP